jgi:nitroreductase
MEIIEAIRTRRSIRAFKPDPVSKNVIEEILDICRWTASAGNAQPWYLSILGGKVLDEIKARLEEKVKTSREDNEWTNTHPDIHIRGTTPYPPSLMPRVESFAQSMLSVIIPPEMENIAENQREYFLVKNQRFHDAPNVLLIYCEDANPNTIIAVGQVSETFCLAAMAYGLGTCHIGRPTILWPEIYREMIGTPKVLGSSEPKLIAHTIAFGYPDFEAPVNNFLRPRESLDALIEWHMD